MRHITNRTPEEIYNFICNDDPGGNNNYIILGKSGPTGKTWLWNNLHMAGYTVTELPEMLSLCGVTCNYSDGQNHYISNNCTGWVIIVLNNILPEYRGRFK